MIVELLGPPGAGKSALLPLVARALSARSGTPSEAASDAVDRLMRDLPPARLLAPLLGRRTRRLRTLFVDLPYGVTFMASHPRLTVAAVAAVVRSPVGWDHRWTLFARWAGVAARQQFLRGRLGDGAVIFDEGLYHRSVNLFAWRGLDRSTGGQPRGDALPRELRGYLRLAPPPDLAVFVDAPNDVAARRLEGRGLPIRLRGRSQPDVTRFLEHAARIARAVPVEATARTTWVRIENATTLAAADESLERQIRELAVPVSTDRPADWPVEPARRPYLRRLDRTWRMRARRLDSSQRTELVDVAARLGLGTLGPARSVGAGRSWTVAVVTAKGPILLKRYKATVEDEAIASEHGVLARLAELELPAPRLVAGEDGATSIRGAGGRYAAFRYEDGYLPSHEVASSAATRHRMTHAAGRVLGRLHDTLEGGEPAGWPTSGLDRDGARVVPSARLAARLAASPEAGTAAMADRLLELDASLAAAGPATTLIHGDYGPYNLLVRPGRPILVIDFELARRDWRLVDLATALPRFVISRTGFSSDRLDAFVTGYLGVAPGMRGELALVPSVLELLSLRRAAVCLERLERTRGSNWRREAADRIRVARSLADGSHPLVTRLAGVTG